MKDEIVDTLGFCFNKDVNGGEQLSLITSFIKDSDSISTVQELTLESYCNSASFTLAGAVFTPEKLRDLANQLEDRLSKLKKEHL